MDLADVLPGTDIKSDYETYIAHGTTQVQVQVY